MVHKSAAGFNIEAENGQASLRLTMQKKKKRQLECLFGKTDNMLINYIQINSLVLWADF